MDHLQAIERFARLEATVTLAAQASHRLRSSPKALDDALAALEHEAHRARRSVEQSTQDEDDPARLFECADTLKSLGDRALQACDDAAVIDAELRRAVHEVQNEIAHFRRQLHGSENRRAERPAVRPTAQR